jgi:hypothetical protein
MLALEGRKRGVENDRTVGVGIHDDVYRVS